MRGCLTENSSEIMKEAICHISCRMVAASFDVISREETGCPSFMLFQLCSCCKQARMTLSRSRTTPCCCLNSCPSLSSASVRVAGVQGLVAAAPSQLLWVCGVSYSSLDDSGWDIPPDILFSPQNCHFSL